MEVCNAEVGIPGSVQELPENRNHYCQTRSCNRDWR